MLRGRSFAVASKLQEFLATPEAPVSREAWISASTVPLFITERETEREREIYIYIYIYICIYTYMYILAYIVRLKIPGECDSIYRHVMNCSLNPKPLTL